MRLLPLAYIWMPKASPRIGVEADPAEHDDEAAAEVEAVLDEDVAVGAERDDDAEGGVERGVAKLSLRGDTLANGCDGGAFLQD